MRVVEGDSASECSEGIAGIDLLGAVRSSYSFSGSPTDDPEVTDDENEVEEKVADDARESATPPATTSTRRSPLVEPLGVSSLERITRSCVAGRFVGAGAGAVSVVGGGGGSSGTTTGRSCWDGSVGGGLEDRGRASLASRRGAGETDVGDAASGGRAADGAHGVFAGDDERGGSGSVGGDVIARRNERHVWDGALRGARLSEGGARVGFECTLVGWRVCSFVCDGGAAAEEEKEKEGVGGALPLGGANRRSWVAAEGVTC